MKIDDDNLDNRYSEPRYKEPSHTKSCFPMLVSLHTCKQIKDPRGISILLVTDGHFHRWLEWKCQLVEDKCAVPLSKTYLLATQWQLSNLSAERLLFILAAALWLIQPPKTRDRDEQQRAYGSRRGGQGPNRFSAHDQAAAVVVFSSHGGSPLLSSPLLDE
jgi:hypothetical protein